MPPTCWRPSILSFALFPPNPNVPNFETSWRLIVITSHDQQECVVRVIEPAPHTGAFLLRTSLNIGQLLFPSRRRKNLLDPLEQCHEKSWCCCRSHFYVVRGLRRESKQGTKAP